MKCSICRSGDTSPGKATVTLQRGGTVVIIKEVPADVCGDCGEYYLSSGIAAGVYAQADAAAARKTEVEIIKYAA